MSQEAVAKKFNRTDAAFALLLSMVLFLLIFKLPPMLLDLLLVVSISSGFLILLLTIYVDSPIKLSSFPSILLVMTLFRLGLNVSSTKLILLDGNAGQVIDTFGNFVIQGNYIVGTVIFLILVMIQFKVITAGSGRIAEVSARFTLDAMPGKQMSIDADLNAGIIDETEAQEKRDELNREAAFYGSMDGANKFVKGDVVAGLIITSINIVGGILIGTLQKEMEVAEALKTYTILTIGDGLVSQIPSLVVSMAAGILVTRASDKGALGTQITEELFSHSSPLYVCSAVLIAMAILPGLPFFPFAVLGIASAVAGKVASKKEDEAALEIVKANTSTPNALEDNSPGSMPPALPGAPEADNSYVKSISPMSLEIGFSLVPLVDAGQDGDLIERIGNIRQQVYDELGFRIPPIAVNDNIELGNNEYRLLIRGLERARGNVHVGSHLAIDPGDIEEQIEGIRTQDPAFGFDAVWINPKRVEAAETSGYTVVDAASVITTHITKLVRDYASDLLSRQDTSTLVDAIKETNPAVVEELIPDRLNLGVVHRVLQNLLEEQVPVHDMPVIMETLSDFADQTKDPVVLAEFCRQALKGHITSQLLSENNTLFAITLQPELESTIAESIEGNQGMGIMTMAPEKANSLVQQIASIFESLKESYDAEIALLVSPIIRYHLSQLTSRKIPELAVLSYSEISDDLPVEIVASVTPPKGGIAA
ncbi:MAG: flagellar biosynthesis protein FlhA [Lentisphaeraceae bacterium]|nr:flagellar biosynthesis protein FlhA [Lentisphaeraceae bacterium]